MYQPLSKVAHVKMIEVAQSDVGEYNYAAYLSMSSYCRLVFLSNDVVIVLPSVQYDIHNETT